MFYVLFFFAYVFSFVPKKMLVYLTKWMTWIGYDLLKIRRQVILSNLTIAFKDQYSKEEKVQIGRASFQNFLFLVCEFLRSVRHPFTAKMTFAGEQHLEEALSRQCGVLFLIFHMGNWESVGAGINALQSPSFGVVKKVGSKGVNRFVQTVRERNGFHSVYKDKPLQVFKKIKSTLGQNLCIGFPLDQFRYGEPKIPFFSKKTETNKGLAVLAQRFGAPVLSAYCIRVELGVYKIVIGDEIPFLTSVDPREDILVNTARYNKVMEDIIRHHPEQYFWLHRRWKG